MSKITTGYWRISDPLNGYTCIDKKILKKINFSKIRNDFFFETSMLFLLNKMRVNVEDVRVKIKYSGEISNFKIYNELIRFIYLHIIYLIMRFF